MQHKSKLVDILDPELMHLDVQARLDAGYSVADCRVADRMWRATSNDR
jgi:hypothetical protein